MPKKYKKDEIQLEVENQIGLALSVDITKDDITTQAAKQLEVGLKLKQPRVEEWSKNKDLYNNKKEPALTGRFNVPLPILPGYVDALQAKIDDKPQLEFGRMGRADYKRSKKVTGAWQIDSSSARANWSRVDRAVKKEAIFTGVGIYKIYGESKPKYKHHLDMVDPYDYVSDAIKGSDVENHRFGFQDNIFRSKYELEGEQYNQEQVAKLFSSISDEKIDKNAIAYRNKLNRLYALGMDGNQIDFGGDRVVRLVEGFTEFKGVRYYIFFEPETKIWIRCEPLKDVFESNITRGEYDKCMLPFVAWHTNPDEFNFWSKAPADDVRPIAIVMRTIINEALYNISKRNAGQRAYDPAIFKNPALLQFRPDGLVPAYATEAGKNIEHGIYQFETPDNTAITVNLVAFLDNMLGQKTGITASAQGASDKNSKVGVYYGDLQQVADRLGLLSKSYSEAWERLGIRYVRDLWENFTSKMMIKWIGEEGVEFDELRKEDIDPDMVVVVKGGNAEIEADALKQKRKVDTLLGVGQDQILAPHINPKWRLNELLRAGGYDMEDIREATDLMNFGTKEEMSEASQAIQDFLEDEKPKIYYGATTAFMQKIVDFATNNRTTIGNVKYFKMMKYAEQHAKLADENLKRLATMTSIKQNLSPMAQAGQAGGGMTPPATTQTRSQQTSEGFTPPIPR